MSVRETARLALDFVREADTRLQRRREPDARRVVLDARTAMEYAMMAPVARALSADPRVRVSHMSSERPGRVGEIFRDAGPGAEVLSPRRALVTKVDAYLAADLLWATLPRGAQRIQMFHGVAGKYSALYDRPAASMRHWQRLFFINRRRLRNFVAAGAIDPASPAVRLVGMPKVDCLVDGTLRRDDVLAGAGLDPAARTVLYAPTWTPYSSLNALGEALIGALGAAGFTVLVKLHENSRDLRQANSGGIDWVARLAPLLAGVKGRLIEGSDASPWLVAADVLVTDHSSVGFEYLLRDRPLVRVEMPELIARTSIPPDYVQLMADASVTTRGVADTVAAVERAFADPAAGRAERRAVAEDLFHQPGTATQRALAEVYAVLDLAVPATLRGFVSAVPPVPDVVPGPGPGGVVRAGGAGDAEPSMTSVILATYNRSRLLAETLEALAAQECPAGGFEVVVADNGSADDTAAVVSRVAERMPVEYLLVTEPGKSAAVNAALARARGDLLVFTDDDVLPVSTWLQAWTRAFAETGADFGAGRILPRWGADPPPWMSPALYGVLAVPDNGIERLVGDEIRRRGVMPIGANMAVRRTALDRAGGWRTDLGKLRGTLRTGEDHEFFLRLLRHGCQGVYEPTALVYHHVPAERLHRAYFREWFEGNGRTVAQLEAEFPTTDRYLAAVPRYLWREALTHLGRGVTSALRRDAAARFAASTRLLWFAGFVRERWTGASRPALPAPGEPGSLTERRPWSSR